jgi:hypothetical protein
MILYDEMSVNISLLKGEQDVPHCMELKWVR